MTTTRLSSLSLCFFGGVLALSLVGCGDSTTVADLRPPDMAKRVVDLTGPRSGLGEACKSGKSPRGTCKGDDAICFPDGQLGFVDGYCSQDCVSTGCPDDTECVTIAPRFDLCLALCNTDADCRTPNYVCSEYNACVPKLGFYLGSAVRPGTKDGMACEMDTRGAPAVAFEPSTQVSILNGAQTSIAVDEAGGNAIVVWQQVFGTPTIKVASSQDTGATFNPPTTLPVDGTIDTNTSQGDPVAAVDSTGAFYVAWTGTGGDPDQVYVARSTDGGVSFPDLFVASPPDESANDTLSKPAIAIGPDDTIYLSWVTTLTGKRVVRMVASTDQGTSWTDPVSVTSDTVDHENARIAVAADLSVHVAWVELNGDANGDVKNKVAIQRLNADLTPDGGRIVVSGATDTTTLDVPSIAVDGNNLYVAYTTGNPDGVWDIRVGYSADRGTTAKASVKVNTDASCATHFHPVASVDGSHKLHVAFYDNRYLDGQVSHTVSSGTAATTLSFGTEDTVNDMPFPFTTEAGSFDWLGDYLGMVTIGQHVYVGWADTRTNGTAQVFFSRRGF